jgi:hypothetical protein
MFGEINTAEKGYSFNRFLFRHTFLFAKQRKYNGFPKIMPKFN